MAPTESSAFTPCAYCGTRRGVHALSCPNGERIKSDDLHPETFHAKPTESHDAYAVLVIVAKLAADELRSHAWSIKTSHTVDGRWTPDEYAAFSEYDYLIQLANLCESQGRRESWFSSFDPSPAAEVENL